MSNAINIDISKKVQKVLELQNSTPNGVVFDADTILADLIAAADFEVTGLAAELLSIWDKSEDRASIEQMFCLITGCAFEDYLDRCIAETTQAGEEAGPARIKVVVNDGLISSILTSEPVDVEVVYIDRDYEDYGKLKEREAAFYKDPSLKEASYETIRFDGKED